MDDSHSRRQPGRAYRAHDRHHAGGTARARGLISARTTPDPAMALLSLLALLSRTTNLSVGCYCENETRCHRRVLRDLLNEAGGLILG